MKKTLAFLLITLLMTSTVFAEIIYEEKHTHNLTSGAVLESTDRYTENGWQHIDVVKIDLKNENIEIKALSPENGISERLTVKQLAEQYNTKAAINGDFFNMVTGETNTLGMAISDGELLSTPSKDNFASFGLTENNIPLFDYFAFKGTLYTENTSLVENSSCDLYQINKVPITTGGITMITDAWGKDVDIPIGNYAMVAEYFDEGRYKMTAFSWGGEAVNIPENGVVLTANYEVNGFLNLNFAIGDIIRVETEFSPDISGIKESIGGNTLIVKDGKVCDFTSNITGKNPRSAIGFSENTLFLVAVDGRKTDCPGFTQETLAQLMIELGCDMAMNLDGGGSTTLVTEDIFTGKQKVENDVSSLRRVSNAIGVISTLSPLSIAVGGKVKISDDAIISGDKISVSYGFYDKNYNRIPVTNAKITTTDKKATISGNEITFETAGEHKVFVSYHDVSLNETITVLDDIFAIDISPEIVNATENDYTFTVRAYDRNGYSAEIPSYLVNFTSSEAFELTGNKLKKTNLSGTVTATYRGLTANAVINGEEHLKEDNITEKDPFCSSISDAKTITFAGEIKTPENLISILQSKRYIDYLASQDDLYCISSVYDKWDVLKSYKTTDTFSERTVEDTKIVTFSSKNSNSIRLSNSENWNKIIDVCNNTKEKNIVFVTDSPMYSFSSSEKPVWDYYMKILTDKGKNVFVISPGRRSEVKAENGIRYLYVGSIGECMIESFGYGLDHSTPLTLYFKEDKITYNFK